MIDSQNKTSLFLYSQRSIAIATYFGGPVAAGVLIRRNFINLGKEEYGKHALFIGVISTVLLFVGLFSTPEHIIDLIPGPLLPLIYTVIIYLIVDRLQGQDLKQHKMAKGQFYSGWKAAGIGSIYMVIIMGIIFGYVFLSPAGYDVTKYDNGFAKFTKNEEQAIELFAMLESSNTAQAYDFIIETGIPLWEENLHILDDLDKIEGLGIELKYQNEALREYCQLRIESYQLIGKALEENTDKYGQQISEIHDKIDVIINNLSN